MKTILITGAAGFIGSAAAKRLSKREDVRIVGIDNLNSYYSVELKKDRLRSITSSSFSFEKGDICDLGFLKHIFEAYRPDTVLHLAAQAGVRYSIDHPHDYVDSNVAGFVNMLEMCRQYSVEHLVFASSSSVYGDADRDVLSEDDRTDRQVSLYGATKKCDEVLAYSYAKLFSIPMTGLRFFTVYGPGGRPDMAYFSFSEKMISGQKISLYNNGNCKRDFTYIDDIVEGIVRVMEGTHSEASENGVPYEIYNIGKGDPDDLFSFVEILKNSLVEEGLLPDLNGHIELLPMQKGDVKTTCADITKLQERFGYHPATGLEEGLGQFCRWFADYKKAESQS